MMMGILHAIWNGIKAVAGILLPVGKSLSFRNWGPGVRWTLHILLLLLVLVGLYFLNKPFEGLIPLNRRLAQFWLPILFLLIYVLAWAAWWLYKLLSSSQDESDFPDIDEAWEEGVKALGPAGLSLTDLPLFIVLGRPEAPEEHLLSAAQLQLKVSQTPRGPAAPVHLYASRDAIYVTCAGASLLGKQATILAVEGLPDPGSAGPSAGEFDAGATLQPRGREEKQILKMVAMTIGRQTTGLERRAMRREGNFKLPDLLKSNEELDLQTARLEHLCRLIVRDRRPYCPANGIMLLVPFGSTDTDHDAQQTGEIIQRDLATVQRGLRVHCPLFALVCDLETLPGFREFIKRLPAKDRERRLGQRFPLAPDLNGDALLELVDSSVQWLCGSLLRDWVFKLFRVEVPGKDEQAAAVAGNTNLYLLLDELRERQKRLSRVLSVAMARQATGPLLFGGCYLGGTGHDPEREQALVAGLFRRLLENQDYVTWTDQALASDANAQRVASIGYGVLAGAAAVVLVIVGLLVFGGGGRRS
jgi:IcmF-related N-terminal domain